MQASVLRGLAAAVAVFATAAGAAASAPTTFETGVDDKVAAAAPVRRPVVLMHGLMATASAMSHAQGWIEEDFPGVYVKNVETTPSKIDSLLVDINKQVETFAEQVRSDPQLAQGFNLIGHSQGGLIGRACVRARAICLAPSNERIVQLSSSPHRRRHRRRNRRRRCCRCE